MKATRRRPSEEREGRGNIRRLRYLRDRKMLEKWVKKERERERERERVRMGGGWKSG